MAIGFYQRVGRGSALSEAHGADAQLEAAAADDASGAFSYACRREGEFFGYAPQAQLYLLFSYEERDPLTGDAEIVEIPRDHMAEMLMSTQRSGLQRLTLRYRWKE